MPATEQEQSADAKWAAKEEQQRRVREAMARVRHKIVVLSGKGGVGKSTVAANLAVALADSGLKTGLLDVDVHGPSIPKLMGIEGERMSSDGERMLPVPVRENLGVVSLGLLLESPSDAVIWRGPLKFGVIRQFLTDVAWGELDGLVIDCPPGTGDEPLSIAQLIGRPASAVIVTMPNELANNDVRRCITFCRKVELPIAGVIENMSGFVCPKCGYRVDLFGSGGGERLASEMNAPFLGRIPIDPDIAATGDTGGPFVDSRQDSAAAAVFREIAARVAAELSPGPAQAARRG